MQDDCLFYIVSSCQVMTVVSCNSPDPIMVNAAASVCHRQFPHCSPGIYVSLMAAASQKGRIVILTAFKLEAATIRIRNSCILKLQVPIL